MKRINNEITDIFSALVNIFPPSTTGLVDDLVDNFMINEVSHMTQLFQHKQKKPLICKSPWKTAGMCQMGTNG